MLSGFSRDMISDSVERTSRILKTNFFEKSETVEAGTRFHIPEECLYSK